MTENKFTKHQAFFVPENKLNDFFDLLAKFSHSNAVINFQTTHIFERSGSFLCVVAIYGDYPYVEKLLKETIDDWWKHVCEMQNKKLQYVPSWLRELNK